MEDAQYLKAAPADAVGDQVGVIGHGPFACTRYAAFAAKGGVACQVVEVGQYSLDEGYCGLGIAFGKVGRFVV